jgi:hypothetical protein
LHGPEREIAEREVTPGVRVIAQVAARYFLLAGGIDEFEAPEQRGARRVQHIVVTRMRDEKAGARVVEQIARMFGEPAHEYHRPVPRIERERQQRGIRKAARFARVRGERTGGRLVQQVQRSVSGYFQGSSSRDAVSMGKRRSWPLQDIRLARDGPAAVTYLR